MVEGFLSFPENHQYIHVAVRPVLTIKEEDVELAARSV
jgi:hypothetical protein